MTNEEFTKRQKYYRQRILEVEDKIGSTTGEERKLWYYVLNVYRHLANCKKSHNPDNPNSCKW